ncbi:MAG: signal peptidase II, partial [Anaerolineales bacterium]
MSINLIKRYPQIKPISIVILSVLILDQVTKYLARIFLQPKHSIAVLDNFFRLTYVENPGIAFGVRINNKVFFTILTIFAVILIFYYLFMLREQKILRFAFALILGGAFGNLIDRFIYGSVVDFLDFEFFNIKIPPFKFLFLNFCC